MGSCTQSVVTSLEDGYLLVALQVLHLDIASVISCTLLGVF